jgi:mannan endo-1,4-beta-mannosidase
MPLTERRPARPYTDTEHGPIHAFNDHRTSLPEAFDDEYERHLMWAHLATGGAGSGMRWPARRPHLLSAGYAARAAQPVRLRAHRELAALFAS